MLETSLRFSFFLWFCIQSVRKLCWPYSQNISRVRFLLTTTHIWAKTTFFFIYGENYSVRTSVRSYYSAQNTTQDLHFTQCISLSYTDGPLRFHTIQLPLFFISYLNSLFFSCFTLQSHWLPCFSSNMPVALLPQGICTSSSFCLEWSVTKYTHRKGTHFF